MIYLLFIGSSVERAFKNESDAQNYIFNEISTTSDGKNYWTSLLNLHDRQVVEYLCETTTKTLAINQYNKVAEYKNKMTVTGIEVQ